MYIKHFSITLAQYPADFDFKQYTTLYNIFYVYLSYILTMSWANTPSFFFQMFVLHMSTKAHLIHLDSFEYNNNNQENPL